MKGTYSRAMERGTERTEAIEYNETINSTVKRIRLVLTVLLENSVELSLIPLISVATLSAE